MAYEDFTTYTEVDPGNDITVDSSTKVSWVDLQARDITAHLYKDKGIDYFSGDFTHKFEVQFSNVANITQMAFWALANSVGDIEDWKSANEDAHMFNIYDDTENLDLYILENGATVYDRWAAPGPLASTTYFIEIVRDDDGGANNTGRLTAYIRTGSHTGTLQDTLVVDCSAGEQNDFRYLYAVQTRDTANPGGVDGFTQNLDIGEGPTTQVLDFPTEIAAEAQTFQDLATEIAAELQPYFKDLFTEVSAKSQILSDLYAEIAAWHGEISVIDDFLTEVSAQAQILSDLNTEIAAGEITLSITDLLTEIEAVHPIRSRYLLLRYDHMPGRNEQNVPISRAIKLRVYNPDPAFGIDITTFKVRFNEWVWYLYGDPRLYFTKVNYREYLIYFNPPNYNYDSKVDVEVYCEDHLNNKGIELEIL